MKLHLNRSADLKLIQTIDNEGIVIAGERYTSSVAVTPAAIIEAWQPASLDSLTEGEMDILADFDVQVVLLGTGETLRWPQAAVMRTLNSRQIGVEVMDTRAACRTYNVLAGEGRQVIAALLPLQTIAS